MFRYVVYGAGGVGGVVGARLHQAGFATTLIARGEHGRRMQESGLCVISPAGTDQVPVKVITHPAEMTFDSNTVVLLCMKSQHTQAALEDLSRCADASHCRIVCMQNGVANEQMALRFFQHIYAAVVNLPALFLTPGEVVSHADGAAGILDCGCFPGGTDDSIVQIAEDLSLAGFSAVAEPAIMRFKYAKLLSNLGNILQAALADPENMRPLHAQLRDEALACYAAAGIECASRDETRARQRGVYRMVDIPGYERTGGSSWQSLKRATGDIETDYLNGEICLLGRLHGIPTPANAVCSELARSLLRSGQAQSYTSAQLQVQIQQRAGSLADGA